MNVDLTYYNPFAAEIMIWTKQTRLELKPSLLHEIAKWPEAKKLEELQYMAKTIPSSWEFSDYIFCVNDVSRACTHQIVRTRTGSFAQQSMRVTRQDQFQYVMPLRFDREGDQAHGSIFKEAMEDAQMHYNKLLDYGAPIEDARGVLPTNICTNIICKYNLRTLSELARSRAGGRTQDEYRAVVRCMTEKVLAVQPWAAYFLFPEDCDLIEELEKLANVVKMGGQVKASTEILKVCDQLRKRG